MSKKAFGVCWTIAGVLNMAETSEMVHQGNFPLFVMYTTITVFCFVFAVAGLTSPDED
jgi:hypothetical protein